MGIFCSCHSGNKPKRIKIDSDEKFKIEHQLPKEFRLLIKQKYDGFGKSLGLTFEEFCKFIALNEQQQLSKRIFNYFDEKKRNRVNLEEIYVMISKMHYPSFQVEILFDLYDLDKDGKLNKKEFDRFIEENKNLIKPQNSPKFQLLNQKQFCEWTKEHLNLNNLQNCLKCFQNPQNKKEMIREIIKQADQISSKEQCEKMYIISAKWWNKLKSYVEYNPDQPQENQVENSQNQQEPGSIDNSDISGENEGELKPGLKDEDYKIIPKDAWEKLIAFFRITEKKYIYKRNFENIEGKLDLELYPKIMVGVQTKESQNGKIQEILFNNQEKFKMNSDSTMHDVRKKLFKRFRIQTQYGKEYLLYYMISNDQQWNLVIDLDDSIISYPSKTFFTMTKIKTTPQNKDNNNVQLSMIKYNMDKLEVSNIKQDIQLSIPNMVVDVQGNDVIYPGIENLGENCYMNAVLQCLAETPYLSNFLYNQSFRNVGKKKISQPQQITLIEQLSLLVQKLKDGKEQHISIKSFKDAVTQKILNSHKQPIYKHYEPGDSNEFLKDLLEHISQELKGSNNLKQTAVDSLFQGKKKIKTFCKQCHKYKEQDEKINILNLNVLEIQDEWRLQILFFQKNQNFEIQSQSKKIEFQKQRIILQNTPKIKDLYEQISKLTNLSKDQYEITYKSKGVFCRIPENQIQNYLSNLGIRSKKTIYVYELGNQNEANQDFNSITQIFNYPTSNFKQYDIVNFKLGNTQWREGQIVDFKENQYEIKDCAQDQKYYIDYQDVSQFRKFVQNQQNKLKIDVYNYLKQSLNNQYKQILLPMIILIPLKSITLQELKVYVYKQIQRFIYIDDFKIKPNFKNTQRLEDEFKNFFDQPDFPYRIRLLDKDNKCLHCKKTSIIVNNIQANCKGCEVHPIILNFNNSTQPKIILVWNQTSKYLKQIKIISDYDFKLEDYLQQFKSAQELRKNCENCRIPLFDQTFLFVAPIILVIYLPKLTTTQVQFEIKSQNIKDCLYGVQNVIYNLYAVINLKQIYSENKQQTSGHYYAFVKKQDQWIEFNDSQRRKIDLHKITSKNAYLLFYTRQEINDDIRFQLQDFI